MGRLSTIAIAIILLAFAAQTNAGAYFATPVPSEQSKEARKTKLAQIAVIVHELSLGKSRLMLKSATWANPGSGRVMREGDDLDSAILTIYPVSIPVSARLQVITQEDVVVRQYGRVLGAMASGTVIGCADKKKADPDLYILFMPVNGPLSREMPVWLVSLTVDDGGKVTHKVAAECSLKITASKLGADDPSPVVTAKIDTTTASVVMTWKEQSYNLTFDMEIFYAMPDTLWFFQSKAA